MIRPIIFIVGFCLQFVLLTNQAIAYDYSSKEDEAVKSMALVELNCEQRDMALEHKFEMFDEIDLCLPLVITSTFEFLVEPPTKTLFQLTETRTLWRPAFRFKPPISQYIL